MLTNRQLKLIRLLKDDSAYQSIDYLAKKIGVSERTLYSDVKTLKKAGITIVSKRGKGITLGEKRQAENAKEDAFINQTLDRRIEIMVALLFENKKITLKQLSDKYFVSQSSIKYDLDHIEKILSKGNNFKISSNRKGTSILTKNTVEKNNLLLNFNQYVIEHAQQLGLSDKVGDIRILARYYTEDLVSVCKNVLYTFLRKNITTILDVYVESFLSLFITLVSQLMLGNHVEKTNRILDKGQHAFYIGSAVNLLHKASLRLQFNYTNADVEYLSQMLLNYRFEQVPVEKIDDAIVSDLIQNVSKALNIDLSEDRQLFDQLNVHIPAMLYRLKLQTPVKNPFTEQIKLEYSITYNILWIAMHDFGQEIGLSFNEDEIAFLTIYFQLSLEKYGRSRRILIVCQMGIVTSDLLIYRIKNTLPSLDQVEVASVTEMAELEISNYDLILSTVKIGIDAENLHYVSPIINKADLMDILYQSSYPNYSLPFHKEIKEDGFPTYYPFLNQHFSSKEELLMKIGRQLQADGFVTGEFANSLLEREQSGTTESPLGVAVPHGKPAFVKKTVVAFIKLKNKMKWQDYFVDTVFIIAIAKKDMKEVRKIISNIYRFINDEDLLKGLKNQVGEQEVLKLLYGRK